MENKPTLDVIALLGRLEAFLEKSKKSIDDYPIIRIQLAYFLGLVKMNKIDTAAIAKEIVYQKKAFTFQSFIQLLKQHVRLIRLNFNSKSLLYQKVLLFGFTHHYNKQTDGSELNLYLSPVKEELKNINLEYDELLVNYNDATVPYTRLIGLYNFLFEYNTLLFAFKAKVFNQYKVYVEKAEYIKSFLIDNDVPEPTHCANTYYNAKVQHEITYRTFKQLLKITKPKRIWTYVYYDNNALSLCRAANELNIPIVEYQHSQQSDIHFAYAKWDRMDQYGYLFPSIFWVWSQADADRIVKNFVSYNYNPQIIVGGNIAIIQKKQFYKYKEPHAEKGILVSLTGEWIPEFLENFIAKDKQYTWYFRLHPRYPQDKARLIEFKNKYPDKIETEISNALSLYQLFTYVNVNITDASGTALEAEHFGVKSIITTNAGKFIYQKQIEEGDYHFANNEKKLTEILYEQPIQIPDSSVGKEREVLDYFFKNILVGDK